MQAPSSSASAGASPSPSGPRVHFAMATPVTLWLQFNDGTRLGLVQPVTQFIIPGFPGSAAPSDSGAANDNNRGSRPAPSSPFGDLFATLFGNSTNQLLHELFMRSQQESHGPPPTSAKFLDSLPVKVWCNALKKVEKHGECPICLSEYETNDQVLCLPCGHLFHKDCGMPWLKEHNVCPTCRHEMPTQQNESETQPQRHESSSFSASAPMAQQSTSRNQPEGEPEPEAEAEPAARRASRVRPRSATMSAEDNDRASRVVRQRIHETMPATADSSMLPGRMPNDEELDRWMDEEADKLMEQEADELVREELEARENAMQDDAVDEFMREEEALRR